jgi:hypothetical protein
MGRSAFIIIASTLACSAVALAHNTPYSWTAVKARVMLQEGTAICLPPDQRRALDAEIEALLDKFRPLKLTAQSLYESTQNPVYSRLAQSTTRTSKRLEQAQATISAGLSIDNAKCVGQGKL